MEVQQETYWESKEFDDLMDEAFASKTKDAHLQWLKKAYLLAKREAPWADIAGKVRYHLECDEYSRQVVSDRIGLIALRYILEGEGLLAPEDSPEQSPSQPQQSTHWDSKEFDVFIDSSLVAKDEDEELQCLKDAYLLARREAPSGTITVGKFRVEYVWEKPPPNWINAKGPSGMKGYKINLEGLRRALKEHGLLDDEDSSE